MPSSSPETLSLAVKIAYALGPRRVLDVGVGYGKYGVLFREYLELRHAIEHGGQADAALTARHVTIHGIEGFAPYLGPLHAMVYDEIFQEDVADFVRREFSYDFIFMGDVLEHLEKRSAIERILPKLIASAAMGVLISVPAHVHEQDAHFDNELERHRSAWRPADFRALAAHVYCGRVGSHLAAFLTNDCASFERIHPGSGVRRMLRAMKRSWRELTTRNW